MMGLKLVAIRPRDEGGFFYSRYDGRERTHKAKSEAGAEVTPEGVERFRLTPPEAARVQA